MAPLQRTTKRPGKRRIGVSNGTSKKQRHEESVCDHERRMKEFSNFEPCTYIHPIQDTALMMRSRKSIKRLEQHMLLLDVDARTRVRGAGRRHYIAVRRVGARTCTSVT